MKVKENRFAHQIIADRKLNFIRPKRADNRYEIENLLEWHYLNRFRKFILQKGYPCMGAQAAVNGRTFALGVFDSMKNLNVERLVSDGLSQYLEHVAKKPSNYMTYIVIFKRDIFSSELEFEMALWNFLLKLHLLDAKNYSWNSEVSHRTTDENFSFSFMEQAFFMVGMHSKSSRPSRRFEYTAIAFNLHEQFENLRKKGRYQPLKKAIRKEELKFSGSINPMLNDFGEGLEAPQYSGRHVAKNWKCPIQFNNDK